VFHNGTQFRGNNFNPLKKHNLGSFSIGREIVSAIVPSLVIGGAANLIVPTIEGTFSRASPRF